jgi:hypothetical protein
MIGMRPLLFALALAGCAGRETVDPDLAGPVMPEPEPPVFEPDEELGPPDPLIGAVKAEEPKAKGPTQHVQMEGDAATGEATVRQPQRTKSGSFMDSMKYAPTKYSGE